MTSLRFALSDRCRGSASTNPATPDRTHVIYIIVLLLTLLLVVLLLIYIIVLLLTLLPGVLRLGLAACGLAYTYGGRVGACVIGATALEEVLAKVANFRWVSHVVYCTVRSAGTLYSI